jgi:putative membrane protein
MKVIVLCVDRDDDLGKKAGIKGPIVGRDKNIKAATELLRVDPGEADGNTIFEAVKIFDGLKDAVEVVTLSGHPSRGYKADKTIAAQLDSVLKKYKPEGVYLVTDGADDDEIIPVVQSRTKIVSKRTLIIKQAKELEKSYYVIKEVLRDPQFARLIFGLPGIILLTLAFFAELGLKIIVFAIGAYLVIKGFGIEEKILDAFRSFSETTSIERASFPLYVCSVLMFILSLWVGFEKATVAEANAIKQVAAFINGFITLFVISLVLFLAGRIGDMHYRGEPLRLRKYALTIVTVFAVWIILLKANALIFGEIIIDEFIAWIVFAFIGSIVGLSIVRKIYVKRYIAARLIKGLEVFDTHGNKIGNIFDFNKKLQQVVVELSDKEKAKIPFSRIVMVKEFVVVRA